MADAESTAARSQEPRNAEAQDSQLWARAGAGDSESFGVLYERHAKAIYNYCFRRTGDWALAEDLLSIVFIEAWRRKDKNLPPGKVLPWLYGIATNVVRSQRRSQNRYAAALQRLAVTQGPGWSSEFAEERRRDQQQMREALTLMKKLPRREQDVIALCSWCGLSYEEAALALGIPIGTVRSRLFSARRRLDETKCVIAAIRGVWDFAPPAPPRELITCSGICRSLLCVIFRPGGRRSADDIFSRRSPRRKGSASSGRPSRPTARPS